MALHCAQCGSDLTPANVHRCGRCSLPFCRKHVGHHACEPSSRTDLARWATSFEKGVEEQKGELPQGPTYRPVSGARLYGPELGGAVLLWFIGIAAVLAGVFALIAADPDVLVLIGIVLSTIGSALIARTFSQMHHLSRFATFLILLVFAAIPVLILLAAGSV